MCVAVYNCGMVEKITKKVREDQSIKKILKVKIIFVQKRLASGAFDFFEPKAILAHQKYLQAK